MANTLPIIPYGTHGNSLEARMAFHIRRLGLYHNDKKPSAIKSNYFYSIKRASIPLKPQDVTFLTAQFQVKESELTRDLTPTELDEFHFYQAARTHVDRISENLKSLATLHGYGAQRKMAKAAGISRPLLNYIILQYNSSIGRATYLKKPYAQGIAEAFELECGAWTFFDGCASPMKGMGTTGLTAAELSLINTASPNTSHPNKAEDLSRL